MKLTKEMVIDEVTEIFKAIDRLNEKDTKEYLITMLSFFRAYIKETKQIDKLFEFVKDYRVK
jgi:hypothetical protein